MTLTRKIMIDNLLDRVGLQRHRSASSYILPAIGLFGAGMLVGGTLAVLFAPASGKETRERIARTVGNAAEGARSSSQRGVGDERMHTRPITPSTPA
jgi:hypothetical protein